MNFNLGPQCKSCMWSYKGCFIIVWGSCLGLMEWHNGLHWPDIDRHLHWVSPGSLMCLGSFYHLSCLCILTNKNKLLFHMTPADQSALFCSLVCLPGLVLSAVTRSPLDGNRTCFPSRVQFSEQHTGLQETALCFWPSSPWASLSAHVCTLYFLCLFQFSTASRHPAQAPLWVKNKRKCCPVLDSSIFL